MTTAEIGQLVTGATGLLLLGLTGYGLANRRYRVPGTTTFVALTLAGALWCFGYAFEKEQTLVAGFLAASKVEYLGLAFLPSLWLLVSLAWIEHPLAGSRWLRALALGASTILVALVWTNEFHHWWYASVTPTGTQGFARFAPGPLYYPLFGLLSSAFLVSAVLLILHRKHVPLYSQKAGIILVANVFPPAFAIAFQFGFRPGGLDPTIFSLIPTFSVLAVGLFRHDFIRIVPIAREMVVESLENPVLVHDAAGRLVDHNAAARPWKEHFEAALASATEDRGEFRLTVEGVRDFRYRRSPIVGPGQQRQGTVTILADVTEEKRRLEELAHQASHDALTGVANRRHFEAHALGEITRAIRHGGTLALVLFDLDRFKAVNDKYGHPAGDQALKATVEVVLPRLRMYDLLARIGGEEFAVLMPQVNPVEAREAAERWRAALEASPQNLGGAVVPVTASFGVATLNDLPLNLPADARVRLDALMVLADKALYRAKSQGRNRVC